MTFVTTADQIVGKRKRQEDALRIVDGMSPGLLCILCDGMGGHRGGDVASALAVEKFEKVFKATRGDARHRLKRATKAANDAIASKIAQEPDLNDMGTTLVAVYADGDALHWTSVGDSHLYRYADGRLTKLNDDHSMAPVLDAMAEEGRISAAEAKADPQRNAIRSAISGEDIALLDLNAVSFAEDKAETYLLASDGLDTLSTEEIEEVLSNNTEPEAATHALLQSVKEKEHPRQDNTSIIVFKRAVEVKRKRFLGLF